MDIKTVELAGMKLDEGNVSAVIATMGTVDKDGDVTMPGFFGTQEVAIAWAHDRSKLVGKGRLVEDGDSAVFTGSFFRDTVDGEQAYLTVKAMGALQEWSYGFNILDGGAKMGQHDGRNVRFLQPLADGTAGVKVAEVSPVLVGAGEGTRTTTIKTEGLRFVEQAEQTAQAAELLYGRAEEIAELRAEKGTALGDEAVARLLDVKTRLQNVAEMFGTLTEPDIDHTLTLLEARRHLSEARAVMVGKN